MPFVALCWGNAPAPYDSCVEPVIVDVPEASRFEARVDGQLAGILEYVEKRGRLALAHTEVLPDFEGRGIASRLAKFGLDEARRKELGVIVICPFVRRYVERHPEERDIVRAGV
jgi:predicted GNAT family acetyltransferase